MSDVDRSSGTTAPVDELSTNALFGLLRDSGRRDALRHLLDREEPVDLDELSSAIASVSGAPSDQRLARVSIDLHHVHLPKLDDAGLVRYDPESAVVESIEPAGRLVEYLDRLDGDDG